MTFAELIDQVVPYFVGAGVIGGLGVAMAARGLKHDIKALRDLVSEGFSRLHEDVAELKQVSHNHDARLRKVEISQAFREGREGMQMSEADSE